MMRIMAIRLNGGGHLMMGNARELSLSDFVGKQRDPFVCGDGSEALDRPEANRGWQK